MNKQFTTLPKFSLFSDDVVNFTSDQFLVDLTVKNPLPGLATDIVSFPQPTLNSLGNLLPAPTISISSSNNSVGLTANSSLFDSTIKNILPGLATDIVNFAQPTLNGLGNLLSTLELLTPNPSLVENTVNDIILEFAANLLTPEQPTSENIPNQSLELQLYTPGSDIAVGFRPNQYIFGRTGNDVLLGFQPEQPYSAQPQIDVLFGDFVIEDSLFRQWSDTFILGDWTRPYYANNGFDDFATIADFNPELDFIQLYGNADDYLLLNFESGSAIIFQQNFEFDLIGILPNVSDLSLEKNYFQFRGTTPPPGPVVPQIQQFGTSGFDIAISTSADTWGNVYVAGGITGSLLGNNAGLRDNFVIKYDSQGNKLFTHQFGTSGFDTIYGIDTDNQGNFYITGITEGELAGTKQAEIFDSFVAKYDSNGNQQWIQQIGQNEIFNAFDIAVDKNTGDVFISGADVQNSIESPDDAFVIKFDTNGNKQWLSETGTSGFLNFDEPYGLTVGQDGSVYATGWTVGDLAGTNAGLYDNWIAKYDNATGVPEWVVQYGTPDYEWSWDIGTDSQGYVYTTGWTLGDLGGTGNAGSFDAYLTKYDNQGNQQWIQQFGSADDDQPFNLFIDQNDNIFVGGYTNGDLGGTNAGSFDAWVAKFDKDGSQQWITQFGTPERDELYSLTGDNFGNLYVTGITQGSLGDINAGSFDNWVAKLDATSGSLQSFNGTLEQPLQSESQLLVSNANNIGIGSSIIYDLISNDQINDSNSLLGGINSVFNNTLNSLDNKPVGA